MPEAVIVATARSPIGRAVKGSLIDVRPDDLAATDHRRASWTRCPGSTRATLDDLMLGCAEPEGEQGVNMARRVAVALGWTRCRARRSTGSARRRCRPRGWPSTRSRPARAHAFVSAGVECVSRYPAFTGAGGGREAFVNPAVRRGAGPHRGDCRLERDLARPARGRTAAGRLHLDGPDRGEPRHVARHQPRRSRTSSACASQNLAEKAIADGFFEREITPVTTPGRHRGQPRRRAARRRDPRGRRRAAAGVPRAGHGHRRQLLPAQRRRRCGRHHVRHPGRRARPHPAGPHRLDRRLRPVARDHGPRSGRGVAAGRWRWPA